MSLLSSANYCVTRIDCNGQCHLRNLARKDIDATDFKGIAQLANQERLSLYSGSYMSAHVLLNLLNKLRERDKTRGLSSIYLFFATSLINSIILEHEC